MTSKNDTSLASIGTGCIFYYYNSKNVLSFLLQKRSQNVHKHKGKIGVFGGYSNHKIQKGNFESAEMALWREIKEEAGKAFRKTLSKKYFTLDNVAKIRPNVEVYDNKERINYHLIWAQQISEKEALLAYPADTKEVDRILHLTIDEVHDKIKSMEMIPWFETILTDLKNRKIIPLR